MEFARADRVGDLLKQELMELLLKEVKDPRIGFTTITAVRVSADLRHAQVYFVTHGTAEGQQRTLEGLQSARSYLRGELGRRLHLRRIPDLTFCLDESLEQGFRIHEILKSLGTEAEPDGE
jgi:ribosome-binding factor A